MRKLSGISLIIVVLVILSSCKTEKGTVVSGLLYSDLKPVSITVNEGRIVDISRPARLSGEEERLIIAPGFIDNQINGYAGVSFTFGGGELTEEGLFKATNEIWKTGVTTYLPTLTTNSNELLLKNFKVLAASSDKPELLGSIPGFHLEGPFISPIDGYRGAHPLSHVRPPDWNEFLELNKAAGGRILQVTLAPETAGAMEMVSRLKELGIIVALGHHNGTAEQINEAVERGARIATHLGNGCANMINRHINPLWPQLANDKLMISIIGDGFHLNPEEIKVFYKAKGPDLTIITSDVTSYASLPPGKFVNSEGDTIELTSDGMIKYPAQNVLAGSASPVKKGIANVMKVTGCSLGEAVRMSSTNPARLYGFSDRGVIEKDKRADLLVFTYENDIIDIEKTYVAGKLVYSKNN